MSQTVERNPGHPVDETFDHLKLSPPDRRLRFDPNMSFRGPKELWAEWTPEK